MNTVMQKENDLEKFWLKEIEKLTDQSYRIQILLSIRKVFPTNLFINMVANEKFLEGLDILDSRFKKWESHGKPPSDDMINAFGLLLAGRPFEDVKEEIVEKAMSRPTTQNGSYEKKTELTRRKRTVIRSIYRAEVYLKDVGFKVKHRPPQPPDLEQFLKLLKSTNSNLEE
jgi:hypothetical protein